MGACSPVSTLRSPAATWRGHGSPDGPPRQAVVMSDGHAGTGTTGPASGPAPGVRGAGSVAGRGPGRPEPGPGASRRGGDGQVGPPGLPAEQPRMSRGQGRGGRVGDGAGLRRVPPAVRPDTRRLATSRLRTSSDQHGVRPGAGRPRSVPRRPGPHRAPVGGRGGAADRVPRGRRPMARPGLGTGTGVRGPPAPPPSRWRWCSWSGAQRRGPSPASPSWWSGGCATATPARCSTPSPRAGWTSGCGTGSSPRPAATRSRSWSCPGG